MGKARRRAVAKGGPTNDASSRHLKSSDDGRKSGNPRRKGSQASNLYDELAALGLQMHEVSGDGNCFFRTIADQLRALGPEFHEEEDHHSLRNRVVAYMRSNKDAFEPFVEDEEPWDKYIERMELEGEWAGNLELQAASMELGVNIRVYQAGQPPWTVKNHPETAPLLHVSYHDGSHYNSVRPLNNAHRGPALPPEINSKEESLVMRARHATGCSDDSVITATLERVKWNLDAAIEELLTTQLADEGPIPEKAVDHGVEETNQAAEREEDSSSQSWVRVHLEVHRGGFAKNVRVQITLGDGSAEVKGMAGKAQISHKPTKRSKRASGGEPGRNARCPCGSMKKYKNCCGAAHAAHKNINTMEAEHNGGVKGVEHLPSLKTLYI